MRTSRRILLTVLVLALALVVPLGATAGAKPKPAPPQYYDVTMTLVGSEGLATTCDGVGPITMTRAPMSTRYIASGGYGDSEWPILQVEAAIPWSRVYPLPDGLSGDSLSGCHGVYVMGGSVPYTPLLQIDTDSAGKPVSLVWHFDRYAEKVGKRTVLREGFDLISGDDFACAGANPYSCSGTFSLESFVTGGARVVHGAPFFEFTIGFSAS